ncbi:hypothetical protein PVL29_023659 [Vitis rotundifolia]|uniref:adenine phosphoribosyltransferase n=1 Tax=Vitis rotundifolia TaxID=103349 RepID=A0AA38YPF7_VITRO|nr:hypothetical protein PVL29_023659 [Vitis rotundifolia]
MASEDAQDHRIARISSAIRVIPDFPKPGIMFQDITTLLLDPKAFKDTIDLFVERYKGKNISVVAGIEARGFIFGPPIALAIGAKFVPMRKPNKLPGAVISQEYALEYGTDKIEMHVGAVQAGERALVIDDLIATGGTLCAAINLLGRVFFFSLSEFGRISICFFFLFFFSFFSFSLLLVDVRKRLGPHTTNFLSVVDGRLAGCLERLAWDSERDYVLLINYLAASVSCIYLEVYVTWSLVWVCV